MTADLLRLLRCVPPRVAAAVGACGPEIVEIVLDIGRPPVARLACGYRVLDSAPVIKEEVTYVIDASGGTFLKNNRAGIDGTLHRLSVVRDRRGEFVGITLRIGRHLTGVADPLRTVLLDTEDSVLLIGPPGAGKTTLLRDCTRLLSDHLGPAVLVVDSHNEIGGDGAIPHPAIGAAKRLQVPDPDTPMPASQRDVMIEGVRNHFPEVMIVDEVTTRAEAEAARTIARRGVRLIATAHGDTVADIVHNPEISGLVGQPAQVAGLDGPRLRRTEPPIIHAAIGVRRDRMLAIYRRVVEAVDAVLTGTVAEPDEIVAIPIAREQAPAPPPVRVRTHEDIPESDPWGWDEGIAL